MKVEKGMHYVLSQESATIAVKGYNIYIEEEVKGLKITYILTNREIEQIVAALTKFMANEK